MSFSATDSPPPAALVDLLEQLAKQGMSQTQVAEAIQVAPQYLSDIKLGRRPLTERIARRLSDEFGVDLRRLSTMDTFAATMPSGGGPAEWLPVLPHPIEGDPRLDPRWKGTFVPVPALAFRPLAEANWPYVLRFDGTDCQGRLHRHDLVLMSQSVNPKALICVVRTGAKCFLARHHQNCWARVNGGATLTDVTLVGHCLGVLWSTLT